MACLSQFVWYVSHPNNMGGEYNLWSSFCIFLYLVGEIPVKGKVPSCWRKADASVSPKNETLLPWLQVLDSSCGGAVTERSHHDKQNCCWLHSELIRICSQTSSVQYLYPEIRYFLTKVSENKNALSAHCTASCFGKESSFLVVQISCW